MAAVTTAAAATLTPPSSSHGRASGRGDWDFSVPIDGAGTPLREASKNIFLQRATADSLPPLDRLSGHEYVQRSKGTAPAVGDPNANGPVAQPHTNGYHHQQSLPRHDNINARNRGDSLDHKRAASPDFLLAAPKLPMLRRQDSNVSSNHDGDSVFDFYGGRLSTVSGVSAAAYAHDTAGGGFPGVYTNGNTANNAADEPDDSKWIHRDKLAEMEEESTDHPTDVQPDGSRWIDRDKLEQIEIQELQQAGIHMPPRSSKGHKARRASSPSPIQDENERVYNNPNEYNNDLRTPEEQAADAISTQSSPSNRFRRKPSYCRIPLSITSPSPIPQEFIGRVTPLQRNPTSPNGSEDGVPTVANSFNRLRKRSYSAGSGFVLDDLIADNRSTPTPSGLNSPHSKTRSPMSPTSGGRRSAAARTNSSQLGKQRTRSNPQLQGRPGTSASYSTHTSGGGNQNSASKHSNAPEGPPPWSLSNYNPDPSLPPDQQIIPTVARRLQQEQWERDGMPASVYDRQLRPLMVNGDGGAARHSGQSDSGEPKDEWPLTSPVEPESPGYQAKQISAYRTMPNVNGNPINENMSQMPPPFEPLQEQQSNDTDSAKKKKKKGLCCCTIM